MGTSRVIKRWSTDFLSTDGRDVCVEHVVGDSIVIVLDNDTEISTHPLSAGVVVEDFVIGLLEVLELARLKSWHESLAKVDDEIDRRGEARLDEAWAIEPTDEDLQATEEYNVAELELGGEG